MGFNKGRQEIMEDNGIFVESQEELEKISWNLLLRREEE
jgi:hypothetical protein